MELLLIEKCLYQKADEIVFSMEGGKDYIIEKGWDLESGGKIDLKKVRISSGVFPNAYKAAIIAPALVPLIVEGFMFCSSRNLIAPAWAIPFEPPPDKTRPIFLEFKSILFLLCNKSYI